MLSSTSSVSDRIPVLTSRYQSSLRKITSRKAQKDAVVQEEERLKGEILNLNTRLDDLKIIETYLSKFADERQEQVYRHIETTVTEGLQTVFEEDLRLVISSKMVGARSETHFNIVSDTPDGELSTDILSARGGGVAGIVGFLIQATLVLLTPNMRPFIALDEAFRGVSSEYQERLGEFISDLCERTGLQVLLVTHQPEIAATAGVWYDFSQRNGRTVIRKKD